MRGANCLAVFLVACGALGCHGSAPRGDGGASADLTIGFGLDDLAGDERDGAAPCSPDPALGPTVRSYGYGAPIPLGGSDPNVASVGLKRGAGGEIGIDPLGLGVDHLWLANYRDWGRGTLTKLNIHTLREEARYFTVTCQSRKLGSSKPCDGKSGCCAADSGPEYWNRSHNVVPGPAQPVQMMSNDPSRTAVYRADAAWVANRAFSGQGSVTKVAVRPNECLDRNRNGRLDTSRDVNGDGVIQTDCNGDGTPDDLAGVQARPCANRMAQEFFGLDDECVLFTTNVGEPQRVARALALAPSGANPFAPWDAWVGMHGTGEFFRVNASSGMIDASAQLPKQCQPYGAVADRERIVWATNSGSELCYFDAADPTRVGRVRQPAQGGVSSYGITVDRDQNLWTGGFGQRYTPDRSQGWKSLGSGYWTLIRDAGKLAGAPGYGYGVAADARTPKQYWVWLEQSGWVVRLPGSDLALPKGNDVVVDGANYPAVQIAGGGGRGVGVDLLQHVWSVSIGGSVATRIKVDAAGTMKPPDIVSAPQANLLCPAGDRCAYADRLPPNDPPAPYTYSDYTGFAALAFGGAQGVYSYLQKGCDCGVVPAWGTAEWSAGVPLGSALTAQFRGGATAVPDGKWTPWSSPVASPPLDLSVLPDTANFVQVRFEFNSADLRAFPTLKGFTIKVRCDTPG